jgi:hypothetical protein
MALTAKSGVTVKLFNSSNQQVRETTTDASGAFSFTNIAYGEYQVLIDVGTIDDFGTFKSAVIVDVDDTSPGREVNSQGTYGVTGVTSSATQANVAFEYNKAVV